MHVGVTAVGVALAGCAANMTRNLAFADAATSHQFLLARKLILQHGKFRGFYFHIRLTATQSNARLVVDQSRHHLIFLNMVAL